MEPIRTFIAIELPSSVRSILSQLEDRLKLGHRTQVKWVAPDSIHLTLKFLGNVDAGIIPDLGKVMDKAVHGITSFHLKLGMLGAFPDIRAPRVIWVGIGGDLSSLLTVQSSIESSLIPLGFTPEKRPFSPHLTLGRIRERASSAERRNLGEVIESNQVDVNERFAVGSIRLMKSTLTRDGAVYNCLYQALLAGN